MHLVYHTLHSSLLIYYIYVYIYRLLIACPNSILYVFAGKIDYHRREMCLYEPHKMLSLNDELVRSLLQLMRVRILPSDLPLRATLRTRGPHAGSALDSSGRSTLRSCQP